MAHQSLVAVLPLFRAFTGNVYSKVRLDKEVSDAEALHRKQVAKIVAQLTPEQIAAQQVVVEKHVNGQAETEGLSELERIQLQVDTLQHNGLPIPDDMMAKIRPPPPPHCPPSP